MTTKLCSSCVNYRRPFPGGPLMGLRCSGFLDKVGGFPIPAPNPNYNGVQPEHRYLEGSECTFHVPMGPGVILLVEGEVSPRYFHSQHSCAQYVDSLEKGTRWVKWNLDESGDGAVLRHYFMEGDVF